MVDTKKLVKKLVEVSKAIGYLQKDKKNTMQGYNYLSEAKIKETIKKEFETQGIVFNYSTEEVREYEISPTHKGTKQFVTIAKGTYHFMDSESDVDISGTWFGSGSDTSDKGLYKAITGGIKYVLNTNFLIPTGDDPENDGDNGDGSGTKIGNKTGNLIIPKIGKSDSELKKELMKKHDGDKAKAEAEYKEIKEQQKKQMTELEHDIEQHLLETEGQE